MYAGVGVLLTKNSTNARAWVGRGAVRTSYTFASLFT